jgi:tyrosine-specific transport protein
MIYKISKVFTKPFLGAMLIGGTAIGAAMLANPVATAGSGILPSYFIYFLCLLFSIATGCLFIELSSWLPKNANLFTMAETFLGRGGKWGVFFLYIFQFYLLLIAYVTVGGGIVTSAICTHMPAYIGVFIFTLLFGGIVFLGAKTSSRINAILMVGLILSFLLFILIAGGKASLEKANYFGWKHAFLGLPVVFLSFCYQGTIPTLYNYLDQDAKRSRVAIYFGTLIPFVVYLVWDLLIKGIVSVDGSYGLMRAKALGVSAVEPLFYAVENKSIFLVARFFAFFALTTSFIGVTLAMVDFFADFFHVKATKWNRLYLCLMIFVPVVSIVLINPNLFITALTLAGGFAAALLLGLLPIVLVWIGRKKSKYKNHKRYLFGGSAVLCLLLAALIFELAISIYVFI